MLTRVAPGRYKMVTKTKAGKTGDYEMNFTEHGVFETMTVGGLSASCFYRYLFKFSNNKEMIKTLIPCQFLLITVTPTTPHNRRLGDFEGTWKVCSKIGAEGYLDACGVLDNYYLKSNLKSSHMFFLYLDARADEERVACRQ